MCCLVFLVGYTCRSIYKRFQTFKTTTFSNDLVKDVDDCVDEWEKWELLRRKRAEKFEPRHEITNWRPEPEPEAEAEAEADDEEPFLLGGFGFGDSDEQEDDAQPETEPETEPEAQSDLRQQISDEVDLALLTSLCADKLHVEVSAGDGSGTNAWSDLSTKDFDRFSLELSRVEKPNRKLMLDKWQELRVNEMLAHRAMNAQIHRANLRTFSPVAWSSTPPSDALSTTSRAGI
jgi:hypothetical protein